MKNMLTIAKYELKRLFRDRGLVIMVLSQPIVIALIIGLVANHDPSQVKVSVDIVQPSQNADIFIEKLQSFDDLIVTIDDNASQQSIVSKEARAVVTLDIDSAGRGSIKVVTDPGGNLASIIAEKRIGEAASFLSARIIEDEVAEAQADNLEAIKASLPPQVALALPNIEINGKSVSMLDISSKSAGPKELKYFDYYGSSMMVVLVILVILNLSGISITSERVSGTFERMGVTPFTKVDIIMGKAMALFLVGLLVNVLGILSSVLVYDLVLGNLALLSLVTVLVVAMAVGLGLLVSSLTKTVVESVELAMYVFFISFLASGVLLAPESSYKGFNAVVQALPFFHAVDASRRINMLGAAWSDISTDVYIVAAYVVLFLVLATLTLRRKAQ